MNSLTELKKIIQALNENITDDDINAFKNEISLLGQQNEGNQPITSFLKMMQSLGKYLGARKNNAHADSIPALNSIAEQLEKIINDPDLKKNEIHGILSKEIKNYKSLKNKIASKPDISDDDINDLKSVILAIDWEVSHTTLQSFEAVTTNLLLKFKNYKIHHTFLKIIHSTGRYIGKQKANAHTDSISFLRSVFKNFEQLVQAPDMTFRDKKQILETDINRFHEFKQKIDQKKERTHLPADTSEDESIQPALSHIKQTGTHAADDLVPLTPLTQADPETIAPSLANKKKSPPGPMDVMDDLFSIKESPADELLDAIHLQDVHGPNHNPALNMLDQTEDFQSDGVKNFTPKRLDNEPIPEIGSRLDEFFNLDIPGDSPAQTVDRDEQAAEIRTIADDSPTNGIVPFQDKDESVEESLHKSDDNDPLPQDPGAAILGRLQSTIETSEWLQYKSSLLSINEDISYLEKRWQNDPEKTCLLQIISSVTNMLQNQPKNIQQKIEAKINKAYKGMSDTTPEKPSGFWGKIKKMFTS
ncbi:MAG: hypothetical protein K8S13_21170 [Desulfobacula sp.]|uniref:hypothetical protein n=1 Tax=Desulfobacula sp. TaxID=2593537 RepID=UPI0025C15483|nr:hypothetical protein [Desulfobacula sp.]MCD4722344.1 hypothetical protein [Desulfobacula sp.]